MAADAPETSSVWKRAGEIFAVVGPSVTTLTALLIYFGWVRSHSQARYMGIDVSLFGYTTQDLIINSIGSFYWPLLFLIGAAFIWLWLDGLINKRIVNTVRARSIHSAFRTGLALAVIVIELVILAVTVFWGGRTYLPYLAALSFLFVVWAVSISRRVALSDPHKTSGPAWRRAVESTIVFGLISLFLFWGTSNYANVRGQYGALQIEQGISEFPAAQVISEKPLHLSGNGVNEVRLTEAGESFYRYDGLRLLALNNGRYFFLDESWAVGSGKVFTVPDSEAIRVVYGE